ncbi:hypothetical protein LguiA_030239 [Lonicera macranthoides]
MERRKILMTQKPIKSPGSTRFLPSSISSLQSLTELTVRGCNISDGDIPVEIGILSSLKLLDFGANIFCFLPDTLNLLSKLEQLILDRCESLKSLPKLPPNIKVILVVYEAKKDGFVSTRVSRAIYPDNWKSCFSHFESRYCGNYYLVSRIPRSFLWYEIAGIEVVFEIAPSASIVVKMCQLQLLHRTPYTRGFSVDKIQGRKYGFDIPEARSGLANKDEDPKRLIMEDEDQMINNKSDTESKTPSDIEFCSSELQQHKFFFFCSWWKRLLN